ncbi:class I SAM-dependent methyltransferase [Aquihabitans sp. G128]|uniref:class I SAM-dependent methyltransferase n=1 Tax=Aquihabitans sp. G128 TaxID=2849779 RepID=UPI001C228A54|nr:class I SAM-dependent methyltransferase [Aquihabitans sp. G128]QXC59509.1 class I SAM-dependent methyltransferase [Aquihabitans sp. G128]
MAWLLAPLYDRIVAPAEEACFQGWRHELLAGLTGDVLEIGAGTGANVAHYPAAVRRVVFTEPDPGMRRQLEERLAAARGGGTFAPGAAEVRTDRAAALSVPSGSLDAVVGTLVLCTVPDPAAALAEVRRVLKPGGTFTFLEHVAADDRPDRLRWQRRLDPVWRRVAGGCRLTRRTAEAIEAAGLEPVDLTRESARKAIALIRPTIRGHAMAPITALDRPSS